MVEYICSYLLAYCGGHVYPVLAFMEHFFTDTDAETARRGEEQFQQYLSTTFLKSTVYRAVCDRCFEGLSTEEGAVNMHALVRLMSGTAERKDMGTLSQLGWWNTETRAVLSPLLQNICLDRLQLPRGKEVCLDPPRTPKQRLQPLNIEGRIAIDIPDKSPSRVRAIKKPSNIIKKPSYITRSFCTLVLAASPPVVPPACATWSFAMHQPRWSETQKLSSTMRLPAEATRNSSTLALRPAVGPPASTRKFVKVILKWITKS